MTTLVRREPFLRGARVLRGVAPSTRQDKVIGVIPTGASLRDYVVVGRGRAEAINALTFDGSVKDEAVTDQHRAHFYALLRSPGGPGAAMGSERGDTIGVLTPSVRPPLLRRADLCAGLGARRFPLRARTLRSPLRPRLIRDGMPHQGGAYLGPRFGTHWVSRHAASVARLGALDWTGTRQ